MRTTDKSLAIARAHVVQLDNFSLRRENEKPIVNTFATGCAHQ